MRLSDWLVTSVAGMTTDVIRICTVESFSTKECGKNNNKIHINLSFFIPTRLVNDLSNGLHMITNCVLTGNQFKTNKK